jgi:prepilin-type N-terminal cleavage/methylation domain-containing protein
MLPQIHRRRGRHAAGGFSLIEVLIAAAILLIIALGLLPLFSRAIKDNTTGNDATQTTNNSRTRLEEMMGVPFLHQSMVVPGGDVERVATDAWAQGNAGQTGDADEGWWTNTTGKGRVMWNRTTRVRQYSVGALADGDLDSPVGTNPGDALPGTTQPNFIHLKEIEVVITNPKQGGVLSAGQGITLRLVRPF